MNYINKSEWYEVKGLFRSNQKLLSKHLTNEVEFWGMQTGRKRHHHAEKSSYPPLVFCFLLDDSALFTDEYATKFFWPAAVSTLVLEWLIYLPITGPCNGTRELLEYVADGSGAEREGEVEDDNTGEMTMIWIRKLKSALRRNLGETDSNSDSGSIYVSDEDADL